MLRGEEREVVLGKSLEEVERQWLLRSLRRAWDRRWKDRVESEEVLLDFRALGSGGDGNGAGPTKSEDRVVGEEAGSADHRR